MTADRPRVLLVDDIDDNLCALEAILRPLGLICVRASSGEEAMKALRDDFALILLDVVMPGPSPDLSSGLMAGARRRLAPFVTAILASGYDGGPAVGPGGRGFHKPGGCPFWIAWTVCAGQGACGSASMRCHAAVIASAHGQVAWIFRRRFRPPRTSRPAACSTR